MGPSLRVPPVTWETAPQILLELTVTFLETMRGQNGEAVPTTVTVVDLTDTETGETDLSKCSELVTNNHVPTDGRTGPSGLRVRLPVELEFLTELADVLDPEMRVKENQMKKQHALDFRAHSVDTPTGNFQKPRPLPTTYKRNQLFQTCLLFLSALL